LAIRTKYFVQGSGLVTQDTGLPFPAQVLVAHPTATILAPGSFPQQLIVRQIDL